MSFVSCLRCIACGAEYPANSVMNLCQEDNRPVEMVIDTERLAAERPNNLWWRPERLDMWRFGGLLGLDIDDALDRDFIIPQGEGCTPLLDYSHFEVAQKVGFKLLVKEEGAPHVGYGANPTRSFKDRGMAMVAAMANKLGLNKLTVPTQGNAGDSLTHYALAYGFEAVIAMPRNTPLPILGRVAAMDLLHKSIQLHLTEGTIRESGAFLKEHVIPNGYFSVATFQEPGWRIEGKKTMGLELAEPREGRKHWKLPQVIVYPTGGGTGILGMWKAFDELEQLCVIGPERPRMICVQSEVTQPLVSAFVSKAPDTKVVDPGETLAVGLNVPGGVGHFKVLEIMRQSGGCAVSVDESQISETLSQVFRDTGWWICPEGAACLAALGSLVDSRLIQAGDEVVVFNTGSFEKYLNEVRHLLIH